MENKVLWRMGAALLLASLALAAPADEADAGEAVRPPTEALPQPRPERAAAPAKNKGAAATGGSDACKYQRGPWTECNTKTNSRSRTLSLKKGDPAVCQPVKTIQKKCKKACRYEKSPWSSCGPNGEMSRTDTLKPNSDPTCDKNRRITKKCNKNKNAPRKANKDKGRQKNL